MAYLQPPFRTLRPPEPPPSPRSDPRVGTRTASPSRAGLWGHVLSQELVPWAHTPLPGDGAGADLCDLSPDYRVQNLTRMGLAASVLLLLGVLLCQAWHDHGGARNMAWS